MSELHSPTTTRLLRASSDGNPVNIIPVIRMDTPSCVVVCVYFFIVLFLTFLLRLLLLCHTTIWAENRMMFYFSCSFFFFSFPCTSSRWSSKSIERINSCCQVVLLRFHQPFADKNGYRPLGSFIQFGELLRHITLQVPVRFPRCQVYEILFNREVDYISVYNIHHNITYDFFHDWHIISFAQLFGDVTVNLFWLDDR